MIDEKKLIERLQEWANRNEMNGYLTAFEIIQDCIKVVEEQLKVVDWIPVSKRLPEFCKHEWIYVDCCRLSDTIYYDVKCEKCKKEKSIVIKRVQDEEI